MKGLKSLAGKKDDFFSLKNCIALVKWPRTASSSRLAAMFLKLLLNEKKKILNALYCFVASRTPSFLFSKLFNRGPFLF